MMREPTTRRGFLIGAATSVLLVPSARATPDAMRQAMHDTLGDRVPRQGRITLDIPPLVENGNTVPLTIAIDSPMSESDYVKTIYVFNEKNPQPYVVTAHLTPRNGKAQIATRIKLADSQKVIAIAEMSDGSLWSESADVIVTIAACVEDL
jgi:sulfur-oxidizing protein SoxY